MGGRETGRGSETARERGIRGGTDLAVSVLGKNTGGLLERTVAIVTGSGAVATVFSGRFSSQRLNDGDTMTLHGKVRNGTPIYRR